MSERTLTNLGGTQLVQLQLDASNVNTDTGSSLQ